MRKPLMAGNWKMNLTHLEAIAVTQKLSYGLTDKDYDAVDVAVIPPFVDIRSVQTMVDGDKLRLAYGAQDVSPEKPGAFTGDISASMLAKLGCSFVIVGHSERRTIHSESSALVNRKARAVLDHEMVPIICIGEELAIRESGGHVNHVLTQLRESLAGIHKPDLKKIVIAYEPVWAIGTGRTATPQDAQEVCAAIRQELVKIGSAEIAENCRILYGGSVKAINIVEIMKEEDIDGALVGGASLDPEEFARIAKFYAQN
ncbi:MAG: triose-phosphate isomerase [Actinomycetes bacterium]|jgi:triosephosphate isomerase